MSHELLEEYPLIDYLSSEVIGEALKDESGDYSFIYLWDYFFILSFLYELGAILGSNRREKMALLESMIIGSKSNLSIADCQKMADERLRSYKHQFSKEPATFYEFILKREIGNFAGRNPFEHLQKYIGYSNKELEQIHKSFMERYFHLVDEKVKVKEAENTFIIPARKDDKAKIRRYTLEGIGFGIDFPELTEKMNHNFWDSIHVKMNELSQKWRTPHPAIVKMRQRSDIPWLSYNLRTPLTVLSFNEQLERILRSLALCIWLTYQRGEVEGYSDLLDSLGLKSYAPQGKELMELISSDISTKGQYTEWFIFTRFIEGNRDLIDINYMIPLRSFGGIC